MPVAVPGAHHSDRRPEKALYTLPYYGAALERHVAFGTGDLSEKNDEKGLSRFANSTAWRWCRRSTCRRAELLAELAAVERQRAKQPADEIDGRGFGELPVGVQIVDPGLQPNVRRRLDLQVTTSFVHIQIVAQGAFDVARAGVVPFDQVAVVAVHDPHQAGRRARVQAGPEDGSRGRQVGDEVGQLFAGILDAAGFNPSGRLQGAAIDCRSTDLYNSLNHKGKAACAPDRLPIVAPIVKEAASPWHHADFLCANGSSVPIPA